MMTRPTTAAKWCQNKCLNFVSETVCKGMLLICVDELKEKKYIY